MNDMKYCLRYIDDAPGIRADCERHIAAGKPCDTCEHRNILEEVKDLRKESEHRRKLLENR